MNENEEDDWNQEFDAARKAGLYEKALVMLDEQIAIDSNVEGFYYGKAYILHHDLGRSEEAMICVKKSLELLPNGKHSLLLLGQIYWSLAQYPEALQTFEQLIELEPQNQDAWFYKTAIYDKYGKYQDSLNSALHLLKASPNHHGGLEYKLHCLLKLARYDEVINITGVMINENSQDIVGYFYKMLALYELGRYQEALEYAELVYSKLPNLPEKAQIAYERDTTLYQVLILEELSNLKEAEEKLVNYLAHNPECIPGLENLAFFYLRTKKYQEILPVIERIIAIDPKCQTINALKGYAYYRLMNYPVAIGYFALAINQNNLNRKNLEEALKFKGYSHEYLGEYKLAIECHQELSTIAEQGVNAIAKDSANRLGLEQLSQINIADCLFRLGEIAKSEAIIKQVLEISPKHVDALAMQAKLLNYHKQYAGAIEIAESIIKDYPDYSYAYHARAVGLFHLGRYGEAVSSFIPSFEPDIINPLRIQRYQEALDYLEKIINKSLDNPEITNKVQAVKTSIASTISIANLDVCFQAKNR